MTDKWKNSSKQDLLNPHAASPWASNVVLVKKKDGSYQRGIGSPDGCDQQAAVGPRGSGGTLNPFYSAGEMLKAPVSSES